MLPESHLNEPLHLPDLLARRTISRLRVFHKIYYYCFNIRISLLAPPNRISSRLSKRISSRTVSFNYWFIDQWSTCLHSHYWGPIILLQCSSGILLLILFQVSSWQHERIAMLISILFFIVCAHVLLSVLPFCKLFTFFSLLSFFIGIVTLVFIAIVV